MKASDLKDYVMIGALAGGGYLLYRLISGTAHLATDAVTKVSQTASATSSKIADVAEILLPHKTAPSVSSGTTVILSTGDEIPWSQVKGVGLFTDLDNTQKVQFYYAGVTWRTTAAQPDETGTYYAAPV